MTHAKFTCCLACAALVLMGCSGNHGPDRPAEPARADAVTSPAPAARLDLDAQETVGRWTDSIKTQLTRLAKTLATSHGNSGEWASPVAERISIFDSDRFERQELFRDPVVRVVEFRLPAGQGESDDLIQAPRDAFLRRLQTLLCLSAETPDQVVRFKLFGITQQGEQLKTRQRLTVQGFRAGHDVHSQAVVDATWSTSQTGPPRLLSFCIPSVIQSERLSSGMPLFQDITRSVLNSSPAWSDQLRWGMNTWVRRIDRSLSPDFLGYHGLAVRDVNGDDLEDLYLCQPGGLPNLLFLRRPDGTFIDVSSAAGVDWLDNSTGALLVDLDNDGDADLALATQRVFLVMENDGRGKFSLRTQIGDLGLGYSPTAADFDMDGDLDLYVLRYGANAAQIGDFPTPFPFDDARNGGANVLLENQGNLRFADVTEARGLGTANDQFSFAASWEDYDNDGDLDLYVANDFGPNRLFRNQRGSFSDVSVESGTQDWGFGMSATWADYDRDGNMDLYVSSMFSGAGNLLVPQANFNPSMSQDRRNKYLKMVRGNSLLRNNGQGRFADVTNPMVEGYGGWAWGAAFADINNDGWEDLYVANGYLSQADKDDL